MFTSLCDHAYAPRVKGLPLLDLAALIGHGSKYKTKDFHNALKEAFGDKDYLFGGRNRSPSLSQNKVAVTSTNSTGGRAIVIANYRRKEDGKADYDFERPHEPELEMRVWEAAAATSAAPTYFKPFVNPLTRRTYLDGALQNNNPARLANHERKLIWKDSADTDPDILLSLGTGQNRISILPKLSSKITDWRTLQSTLQTSPVEKAKGMSRLLQSWSVLYNRVDDILNAEIAWAAFRHDVVAADRSQRNTRRYIRFNPDLAKRAPSVDDKNELCSLQLIVKKRLNMPHCVTAVQHVALRLVASSFFLNVYKRGAHEDGTQYFECSVLCKFEDGSQNLRRLGKYLKKTAGDDFHPHLLIRGDVYRTETIAHDFSIDIIKRMMDEATFSMPAVKVAVEDDSRPSMITLVVSPHDGLEPDGFPLSGMPKVLSKDCSRRSGRSPTVRSSPNVVTPSRIKQTPGNLTPSDAITLIPSPAKKPVWTPTAGPLAGLKQLDRADTAPEVLTRPATVGPTVSYQDVKRPNRFWAYIGPVHMAKHRHLYSQDTLERFRPSVAAEPIELDAGDDNEIKRMTYAELENDSNEPKRTSVHHEVHADSSPAEPSRQRKDSATDTIHTLSAVEAVSCTINFPPAFPSKKRGFDPGELESAIWDAFG